MRSRIPDPRRLGLRRCEPGSGPIPERSIRRDIPLTNMIRRAFAAGTRDSSGRPGRNYWQLRTDYSIDARLDPATAAITGRETVVIRNTSDSPMRTIVLRLDQNIYAPNVPRAETGAGDYRGDEGHAAHRERRCGGPDVAPGGAPARRRSRGTQEAPGPWPRPDHRLDLAADRGGRGRQRHARGRLALPGAPRRRPARPPDGRLGRLALPGGAVVPQGRGLR